MEIQYRKALPEDLEAVCRMVEDAKAVMIQNGIYQWNEYYPVREDFREDIEKGQLYVGVWEAQIAVIYVLNEITNPEYENGRWEHNDQPYRVVHRLCVNPAFQRQGVAGKTLLHVEEQLIHRNIHAIRLDTFSQNPYALKLYANLGYRHVGDVEWPNGVFYLMEKYF